MAVTGLFCPHPKITPVPPEHKPFLGFFSTGKQTKWMAPPFTTFPAAAL
jgi:hypothetical protein